MDAVERRMRETRLLNSHIVREEDGRVVFVGMSVEAARLAFSHASAWFRFRQARHAGSFDGMLTAELRAQAAREALVACLRSEGFEDSEIDALLDRHRYDASGDPDPEAEELTRYHISLGTQHPPVVFRARMSHLVVGETASLRITS